MRARNLAAKHARASGAVAQVHRDRKKAQRRGYSKHKNQLGDS